MDLARGLSDFARDGWLAAWERRMLCLHTPDLEEQSASRSRIPRIAMGSASAPFVPSAQNEFRMTSSAPNTDQPTESGPNAGPSPGEATITVAPSDATVSAPPSGEAMPTIALESGAVFGQYRIESKLGEGGMGAVYKALHVRLGKHVAIKVLPAHLMRDPAVLARFDREMKAVGKLEHPHIVRAMDAGESQGVHYLVMEYVEGRDLTQLVRKQGPRPIIDACEIVRQAALGLAHAHENGLVHRDIKPSNLLLSKQRKVKILDLGLARLQDSGEEGQPDATAGLTLTTAGVCMGTPDYMAPEQWDNTHTVDGRTDLYALGCSLFFLLTGQAPYGDAQHTSFISKMKAHVIEPIPDLPALRPDVPAELDLLYRKLLAKNPAERIATAGEVAKALTPIIRSLRSSGATTVNSSKTVEAPPAPTMTMPAPGEGEPQLAATLALPRIDLQKPTPSAGSARKGPGGKKLAAIAGGFFAAMVLLGVIVITIRNRDGSVSKLEVPADASIEITQDGRPVTQLPLTAAAKPTANPKQPRPAALDLGPPPPAAWSVVSRFPSNALSVAASPDEQWLALGDYNGTLRLYDAKTLELRRIWRVGRWSTRRVAFSRGGRLAAMTMHGWRHFFELNLWNLATHQTESIEIPKNWETHALCWAPQAEQLAVGSMRGQVGVWDAVQKKWVDFAPSHAKSVRQVAFSPDGQWIATSSEDNTVHVYLVATGERVHEIPFQGPAQGRRAAGGIAWSPDSKFLALSEGTEDPKKDSIRIIDAESASDVRALPIDNVSPAGNATQLHWPRPEQLIVIAGGDRVLVIDAQTGQNRTAKPYVVHQGNMTQFYSAPSRTLFATAYGVSGLLQATIREDRIEETGRWSFPAIKDAEWQPGGGRLALSAESNDTLRSGKISACDLAGQPVGAWKVERENNRGLCVAWSPDGRQLISAGDYSEIRFYDPEGNFQSLAKSPEHAIYRRLAVSPDGKHVAVQDNNAVSLFDRQGRHLRKFPCVQSFAFAWSADSAWLATNERYVKTQLWAPDGAAGPVIDHPRHEARTYAFNAQGTLAAGCRDGKVYAWDAERQHLWTYQAADLMAHNFPECISLNPAGDTLAVGYGSGAIHLLDQSGALIRKWSGREGVVRDLEWTSDGRFLSVVYADSSVGTYSADGVLQWVAFVLPDGSLATFSGNGKLLHGDPAKIGEHLAFTIADSDGRQQVLSYAQFEPWRTGAVTKP